MPKHDKDHDALAIVACVGLYLLYTEQFWCGLVICIVCAWRL